MSRVIKIATISKTTTGTSIIPSGFLPNVEGSLRADYMLEVTSVGTGDTWQAPTLDFASAVSAATTTLGTFTDATAVGIKPMTWVYAESTAATDMNSVPAKVFRVTLQTAGSSSLVANLYIITDPY